MARVGVTPERLTLAAAELADEVGFAHVTVSALARGFGVTDASLYSHIKNANDLKTRVALLALAELADRVAEAVAGRAGKEALVAFASTHRDYAKQHPGRYASMQFELDPQTLLASAALRHSDMTRAILRGYPTVPEADQMHAVRLLHSTVHGYVTLESIGGFSHRPGDLDVSWSKVLGGLDAALLNWPSD